MRTFFLKNAATGEFVAVKEGETGYYETTVYTQDHADTLNERAGHSPGEIAAAEFCSMFGWDNFNEMVEKLS